MSQDSSSQNNDSNKDDWERTFEMFKLEYVQAAQRYENIYKAIWQIFQYMALLAAGVLTFGSKSNQFLANESQTSNYPFEVIVFIALTPLVFWVFAIYLPMDQYGQNVLSHLKNIEHNFNKSCKNLSFWEIEQYIKSAQPKPRYRVRRAILIFGVIISVAWIFSLILIYINHPNIHILFLPYIFITITVAVVVTFIDICQQVNNKSQSSNPELTPNSTNISLMLEVYNSILDHSGIYYCSAPITSGRRYIEWLESIGKQFTDIDNADKKYHDSHLQEVIEPNRKHAYNVIQKIRQQTGKIVIDPTALPAFTGWTQQDWRYFWQQVIERYVTTIFFINDWQYSNGCVYEFLIAQKKGIPIFDENQQPLRIETGINLITEAILLVQQRGGSTIFIEEVLKDIKNLQIK